MVNFQDKEPGADYTSADDLTSANKSNDAFWLLFRVYLTSEDIFIVRGSAWFPSPPDNKLDSPGSVERVETLRQGECAYLYVTGLNDTSNSPSFHWSRMQGRRRTRQLTRTPETRRAASGVAKERLFFLPMGVAASWL